MIVVADASVIIAVAMGEPEKDRIIALTRHAISIAPPTLPFEVANALAKMVKRKLLTATGAGTAWKYASAIPVSLREIEIEAALRLSCKHNIYAYDGFMLQCALENVAVLLTLDKRLNSVAGDLGLKILE
jgi:predicted nucleic acid-binding protein